MHFKIICWYNDVLQSLPALSEEQCPEIQEVYDLMLTITRTDNALLSVIYKDKGGLGIHTGFIVMRHSQPIQILTPVSL